MGCGVSRPFPLPFFLFCREEPLFLHILGSRTSGLSFPQCACRVGLSFFFSSLLGLSSRFLHRRDSVVTFFFLLELRLVHVLAGLLICHPREGEGPDILPLLLRLSMWVFFPFFPPTEATWSHFFLLVFRRRPACLPHFLSADSARTYNHPPLFECV